MFKTTVIGFAASTLLPARAGEVMRPYLLARRSGFSATSAFATIVLERLLDLADGPPAVRLLSAFFASGLAVERSAAFVALKSGGMLAAIASVAGLAFMMVVAGHPEKLSAWALRVEHVLPSKIATAMAQLVRTFVEGLAVVRQPGRLAVAGLLSFPLWLSIALGIWLTSRAFHIDMSYPGCVPASWRVLVVGVAVPTPGAVGGFHEAYRIGATAFFGVAERSGGRRGHRPARDFLRARDDCWGHLHGPGRAEPQPASGGWPRGAAGRRGMKCPYCGHLGDKVVDSRESKEGDVIRRRRECLECGRRFTSYERVDEIPYMVIKKDGRRERFERQKLIAGMLKACEKRPVDGVGARGDRRPHRGASLQDRPEKEIATDEIGVARDAGPEAPRQGRPTCASRRCTATSATSASSWSS